MVSAAMLIRGALVNALAFTGSSYLFHRLSKDGINAERKMALMPKERDMMQQ